MAGNNTKLVKLIAIWMILVAYPWVDFFYNQRGFIPQSLLEVLAIGGIIWVFFCALGLVFMKEMARRWAVWMFMFYFFWSFYMVCFNIAPFFSSSIEWLGNSYRLPHKPLKGTMLALLVTHLLWPLIVVMYLINPNVKSMFDTTENGN